MEAIGPRASQIVYLTVIASLALCVQSAFACPNIEGFVDYNCDEELKIVITGDSIVAGAGDTQVTGGYPSRLRKALDFARVVNLGFSGIKTSQLTARFKSAFSGAQNGSLARATRDADIIILDVGRNDYHTGASPEGTANRIRALHSLLTKKRGRGTSGAAVLVATLIPTTRVEQGVWVRSLNRILLSKKSKRFPVLLRFESFPKRLLSSDGLHPHSAGYANLAKRVEKALRTKVRRTLLRSRKDRDADGVYDMYETKKFGTDWHSPDSDQDGYLDGEEIFKMLSNPLDPLSPGEILTFE